MDRRIEKTKNSIFAALIELMKSKNFDKITINEIAQKADINRGTFYSHFEDKNELLEACITNQLSRLVNDCSNQEPELLLLESFKHIEENFSIFHTLLNNKGPVEFRNILHDTMINSMYKNSKSAGDELSDEIRSEFFVSGMIGVIEWWINESAPSSAEEIVKYIIKITSNIDQDS